MNEIYDTLSFSLLADEFGLDPIEERLRENVRAATIEGPFEEELAGFLGRLRDGRGDGPAKNIATDTASGSSPAPSGQGPCGCRGRV